MPLKRSVALVAAREHWAKRFKTEAGSISDELSTEHDLNAKSLQAKDTEVIVIGSDSEDEAIVSESTGNLREPEDYGVHVLYNPSYDDPVKSRIANAGAVTIESLVGSEDLIELFQFNFSIEYDFFMSYFAPKFSREKRPITFITTCPMTGEEEAFMKKYFNFKMVVPTNIPRFGSHHTKLMINFFDDNTCQVVIMTCNLAKIDFGALTQMLWKSERLPRGRTTTPQGVRFQNDFANYLRRYGQPELHRLVTRLSKFNFLSVRVELLASAPGVYEIDNYEENYGLGKLYHILKRNRLLLPPPSFSPVKSNTNYNILAEISSIAYPYKTENNQPYNIFIHLLCPLMFEDELKNFNIAAGSLGAKAHQKSHNYTPHILFPSVNDIASNNMGYGAGRAVHFNYTLNSINRNHYRLLKPYMCKWNTIAAEGVNDHGTPATSQKVQNSVAGREEVVPHVKIFLADNGDDWKSLRWFLLTSHNLSKQGWGAPIKAKGSQSSQSLGFQQFSISSYELGVLVPRPQNYHTLSSAKTEIDGTAGPSICVPFNLPPTPYGRSDLPWSPQVNSSLPDRFGEVFAQT